MLDSVTLRLKKYFKKSFARKAKDICRMGFMITDRWKHLKKDYKMNAICIFEKAFASLFDHSWPLTTFWGVKSMSFKGFNSNSTKRPQNLTNKCENYTVSCKSLSVTCTKKISWVDHIRKFLAHILYLSLSIFGYVAMCLVIMW